MPLKSEGMTSSIEEKPWPKRHSSPANLFSESRTHWYVHKAEPGGIFTEVQESFPKCAELVDLFTVALESFPSSVELVGLITGNLM